MTGPTSMTVPGLVDHCEAIRPQRGDRNAPLHPGDLVLAVGWIVGMDAPVNQIWVTIDGDRSFPATGGYQRPDVSENLDRADALSAGFRAIMTIDGLEPGSHEVTVRAIDRSGRIVSGHGAPYVIQVSASGANTNAGAFAFIDDVRIDDVDVSVTEPIAVAASSSIFIRGWIMSSDYRAGVAAFLRSDRFVPVSYGIERPDVALIHGESSRFSGFTAILDGSSLKAAGKDFHLVMIDADGRALLESSQLLSIMDDDCGVPPNDK